MIAEGFTARTTKDKAKPIPYSDSMQNNSFIKFISIDFTFLSNTCNPVENFFNDNSYSNK